MRILAVETSAVAASAALCEDEAVLGEYFTNVRRVHSETLMPMVESLLQSCAVLSKEIDGFAVSAGPGSFTGVRIGVAAVKGMALAAGKPCVGVSSLETLAYGAPAFDGVVCAVMDARCRQVYNALFDTSAAGEPVRLTPDRAVSAEALKNELLASKKNVILVGDGAKICYNILKDSGRAVLAPETCRFPRAACTASAALRSFRAGVGVSAAELRPVYLRLPQAERELGRRKTGTPA